MQTVPAGVHLNKRYAKQKIGYRVLGVDRALFRVFTLATEERPAFYVARGGAEVPDEGGYIVWGTENSRIMETAIQPVAPLPADIRPDIYKELDELRSDIIARLDRGFRTSVAAITEHLDNLNGVLESTRQLSDLMTDSDKQFKMFQQRLTELVEENSSRLGSFSSLAKSLEEAQISRNGLLDDMQSFTESITEIRNLVVGNMEVINSVQSQIREASMQGRSRTAHEQSLDAITEFLESIT